MWYTHLEDVPVVSTINRMPKKPDQSDAGKHSKPKRVSVSIRMREDLLRELDEHCEAQEIPIDRTAFIEVAVRRLLDQRAGETE